MRVKPRPEVASLVRTAVPQSGRYFSLRLDKNERCVGYPTQVIRSMLKELSGEHLTAYPEPAPLYDQIAKWHGISVDQLAVTAGSELAIRYLFEAFLEPDDEVVLLNPSFAMFEVYALLYRAKPVGVDFDHHWHVDPDDILSRITKRTKIVALANPNNPTGTVMDENALLAILRRAARVGALVLVDEAYYHFYKRTMLGYLPQFDNLVVTRTFSKACGAAGVRLGYAIGHRDVIAALNKVQPIDHVSAFAIRVGMYLIDHEELIEQYVKQTEAGQCYLLRALADLKIPAIGGRCNFVLIDLGPEKDAVTHQLCIYGIHVGTMLRLPFSSQFVRVTVGPVSVMRRFVSALAKCQQGVHYE